MRFGALIALVIGSASATASAGEFLRTMGTPGPAGEYVVVFNDEGDDLGEHDLAEFAVGRGFEIKRVWRNALRGAWISGVRESDAIELSRLAGIASVSETQMAIPAASRPAVYGLDRLDQVNLPLNSSYTYLLTGANVDAYILDSGARLTHSEFAPAGRTTLDYNSTGDSFTGDDSPDSHGTSVASIVGGLTYGVANGVRLHIIRACSRQIGFSCTDATFIDALEWVADNHGTQPGVVNISYNWKVTTAYNAAVAGVLSQGILVFISSGNYSVDACTDTPTGAFVVGGANTNDQIYGGYGPCVDAFAWTQVKGARKGNDTDWWIFCCTSASSPVAAGLGALFLSLYPTMTPSVLETSIKGMANHKVTGVPPNTTDLLIYENAAILHPPNQG